MTDKDNNQDRPTGSEEHAAAYRTEAEQPLNLWIYYFSLNILMIPVIWSKPDTKTRQTESYIKVIQRC